MTLVPFVLTLHNQAQETAPARFSTKFFTSRCSSQSLVTCHRLFSRVLPNAVSYVSFRLLTQFTIQSSGSSSQFCCLINSSYQQFEWLNRRKSFFWIYLFLTSIDCIRRLQCFVMLSCDRLLDFSDRFRVLFLAYRLHLTVCNSSKIVICNIKYFSLFALIGIT